MEAGSRSAPSLMVPVALFCLVVTRKKGIDLRALQTRAESAPASANREIEVGRRWDARPGVTDQMARDLEKRDDPPARAAFVQLSLARAKVLELSGRRADSLQLCADIVARFGADRDTDIQHLVADMKEMLTRPRGAPTR